MKSQMKLALVGLLALPIFAPGTVNAGTSEDISEVEITDEKRAGVGTGPCAWTALDGTDKAWCNDENCNYSEYTCSNTSSSADYTIDFGQVNWDRWCMDGWAPPADPSPHLPRSNSVYVQINVSGSGYTMEGVWPQASYAAQWYPISCWPSALAGQVTVKVHPDAAFIATHSAVSGRLRLRRVECTSTSHCAPGLTCNTFGNVYKCE
jgi:hypothetical protein